jgi:uncharacterized RDD family membrane protein YckC
VKCPNCGFVTFPDPAVCKKCGQRFAPESRRPAPASRSITFRSPDRQLSFSVTDSQPLRAGPAPSGVEPIAKAQPYTGVNPEQPETAEQRASGSRPPVDSNSTQWHEEISARVARYRRRRGLPDEPEDARGNLELVFDHPRTPRTESNFAIETELSRQEPAPGLSIDLDAESDAGPSRPRGTPLELEDDAARGEDPAEWALKPLNLGASDRPVEIVLHSGSPAEEDEDDHSDPVPRAASLGRRFAAGVLDGIVLLIAAAAFFLLFRASGGSLDRKPVELAVAGIAAAFLMTFYFSVFTALAFATPGQSAFGLRVRTFDGDAPDVRTSVWRGFGYLVSAASLMLGFFWAALDPERLAWHDRMSGTCLVEGR